MAPDDGLSEREVRAIVRDELIGTSRTVLETALWTILSLFAILVGLQLVQLALYAPSILFGVGFVLAGGGVTGAGLYLLYLLHWV
ncbi:hypothetical protein [Halobacterium bonnevillei]|uniref:Uncharacterized protein n=1 Tax=Halobacterium bonnevillei TaxID=2692200 RepID=A0A6B0SFN6_9EURY|nr:hypothetical protein [Halobacterium bonnevillei]MXR19787.1 hypothetical protein [Halobacterium bonnevillei]